MVFQAGIEVLLGVHYVNSCVLYKLLQMLI